jgi:hypothetical protein
MRWIGTLSFISPVSSEFDKGSSLSSISWKKAEPEAERFFLIPSTSASYG